MFDIYAAVCVCVSSNITSQSSLGRYRDIFGCPYFLMCFLLSSLPTACFLPYHLCCEQDTSGTMVIDNLFVAWSERYHKSFVSLQEVR